MHQRLKQTTSRSSNVCTTYNVNSPSVSLEPLTYSLCPFQNALVPSPPQYNFKVIRGKRR